jgi:hypothetical protein
MQGDSQPEGFQHSPGNHEDLSRQRFLVSSFAELFRDPSPNAYADLKGPDGSDIEILRSPSPLPVEGHQLVAEHRGVEAPDWLVTIKPDERLIAVDRAGNAGPTPVDTVFLKDDRVGRITPDGYEVSISDKEVRALADKIARSELKESGALRIKIPKVQPRCPHHPKFTRHRQPHSDRQA